jgi:hypothetical protein
MALAVVTINNASPQLDKRAQEVILVARALALAAQDIASHGSASAAGNILNDGGAVVGSWTYTAQASS